MTRPFTNSITLAAATEKVVADGLAKTERKHGHTIISASASQGTIGREHLMEPLDLVEQS